MRRELVDADLVEAVIQLPLDMFYGAGIAACYLVLNRAKPAERAGKVVFIEASELFERTNTKNVLLPEHIDRIVEGFETEADIDRFSTWVPVGEIAKRRYNLTVRRYVVSSEAAEEQISLAEALDVVKATRAARAAAEQDLNELLATLEQDV